MGHESLFGLANSLAANSSSIVLLQQVPDKQPASGSYTLLGSCRRLTVLAIDSCPPPPCCIELLSTLLKSSFRIAGVVLPREADSVDNVPTNADRGRRPRLPPLAKYVAREVDRATGRTWSTRCTAASAMRRVVHDEHTPLALQEGPHP